MVIEHDFFGLIDDDGAGGLYWNETIEVGEQSVLVTLTAGDAEAVTDDALEAAAAMIHSLDAFDARARDALIAELSERESATVAYIDQQVDDMGETLLDLLVHTSGDIPVDVLRSLQLVRVAVLPANYTAKDAVFAIFEFSISPEDTDDLLVVSFDGPGDVVGVEVDS